MDTRHVLVSLYSRMAGVFDRDEVRLFVPVDKDGNVVAVENCVSLECWVTNRDVQQTEVPERLRETVGVFQHALLGYSDGGMFATLPYNAAMYSIGRMTEWFQLLHRAPEGDIQPLSVKFSRI